MNCPAENTWQRYVVGALEAGSASVVEHHLDTCETCRFVLVNLAKASANDAHANTVRVTRFDLTKASANDAHANTVRVTRFDLLQPDALPRGSMIDRYVVLGTLGRGGMGVVYKAFDPQLDRPIALKLVAVKGVGFDAEQSRARLLREAKTLAQLSHPNVVAVHDVGAHDDDVFVAMEFVAGTTLRTWLQQKRTPREILAVFRAAGAGLAAAHRVGIVHRDFKPENVMVDDDGRVRVLDFGLARTGERTAARPSLPSLEPSDAGIELTRTGAIMGTPAYMAPEQDLGNEVDARSDQFSFCAALYEALYRQRAFAGDSYLEIASHRLAGEVQALPGARGISSSVRRAVMRGLRVDPGQRHTSMEALLAALGVHRRRVRIAAAVLALAALGAGGWATWVALNQGPTTDEQCDTAAAEVDRMWNPTRRSQTLAIFDRLNEHAGGLALAEGIDRYTHDWRVRRTGMCKVLMGTNRAAPRDFDASSRVQCLRGALTTLDALVGLVETGNERVIRGSRVLLPKLKPLASCDNPESTPIVNETSAAWKPIINDYLDGKLAMDAGKLDEAERHARRAVELATETDQPAQLGNAYYLLGQVLARNGSPAVTAKAALLDAVRAATTAHDDRLVVDAWTQILTLAYSNDRTMVPTIGDAIFTAELAALRLNPEDPSVIDLSSRVARLQLLRGEIDDALARLEKARAYYARQTDTYKLDIAAGDNNIAVAHMYRGELDLARAALDRALAVSKALPTLDPILPITIGWYGELASMQHDFAAAARHHQRELELVEQLGEPARIGKAQVRLGYVYARAGRCEEAMSLIAKARTHEVGGEGAALVPLMLLAEGHCALATGNPRKALPLLEQAAELGPKAPASAIQMPLTDFTLARALVMARQDKRRAIALAKHARDQLARYPGARADRDEIEAWLAAIR